MMSLEDILQKINLVFQKEFNDYSLAVSPETTAKDVNGWDSLVHMSLINNIEKAFGVEFGFDEVMNFENVGDIIKTIQSKG